MLLDILSLASLSESDDMLNSDTQINLDHPHSVQCFIDDEPEPSDPADFLYPLADDAAQAAADAAAQAAKDALIAIMQAKRDRRAQLNAQAATASPPDAFRVNLTLLGKIGGPLTKLISLLNDTYKSDGSQCWMAEGLAIRVGMGFPNEFAKFIGTFLNNEALTLGTMNDGIPDLATILTKDKLELDGAAGPEMIARSGNYFSYKPGEPALVLLDVDTKGMPDAVRHRIASLGGVWPAILTAAPELANAACVVRRSTSAGLFRSDTGELFAGSDGQHIYLLVKDGSTAEHLLRTLHDRCWLLGLGWWRIGNAGQFLNCSLIDRSVYRPERLVFEADADVVYPMAQDRLARVPVCYEGEMIDVAAVRPPLTVVEKDTLSRLQAAAKALLHPEASKVRAVFVKEQSTTIRRKDPTISADQAKRIVLCQIGGTLLPDIELPFDDAALAGTTVGDILDDPQAYYGLTLADPLAGVEYGKGKAMVLPGPGGAPIINSFAHGGGTYAVRHDVRSIERAMREASSADVIRVMIDLIEHAEVAEDEQGRLKALAVERSGVKAAPINAMIKSAGKAQAQKQMCANAELARLRDPRISRAAPPADAERMPVLAFIDGVLASVAAPEPPMRTLDGKPVEVLEREPAGLHALTSAGADGKETEESRLPPPAIPLLTLHTRNTLELLIETHIRFTNEDRAVALHPNFIASYEEYRQSKLPVVAAVATLPIMLDDGTLLSTPGLDRKRQAVLRIPPKLVAMLPTPGEVTDQAVANALDFLVNDWLGDVSTDFAGKCVLVSYAMSIIERPLLPERPVFFVSAGKRGGGKTTAISMMVLAATGKRVAAAAWSPSEEERRKSLFAYLGQGLATLCWDNLPTGSSIGCPSIEKSCTAATYTDRTLGASEFREVSAATIQSFTGNNVTPLGDLAARSLIARIEVDRSGPENCTFRHPDPIGWTEAHRGQILRALYTIMLGNPVLIPANQVALKTRFKTWWKLVGSSLEHAAGLLHARENRVQDDAGQAPVVVVAAVGGSAPSRTPAERIDFKTLFAESEEDEEVGLNVAAILDILSRTYGPDRFTAQPLAEAINGGKDVGLWALRDLLEDGKENTSGTVTALWLGKKLKVMLGNTTTVSGYEMTLRREPGRNGSVYRVDMPAEAAAEIMLAKDEAAAEKKVAGFGTFERMR